MVKQREVSDLAPFCFVMKIYSCRKTRRAIFRVNSFLLQNKASYFRSVILFQDARTSRADNVRRFKVKYGGRVSNGGFEGK